jgi:hypothetical protein
MNQQPGKRKLNGLATSYTSFETVTATTTPLPTTTTQTSSKPAKPLKLVAIGAVIGAALLAAIVFACCFIWKLRGRKKRSDGKSTNAAGTALLETEPESPSVVYDISSLRPSELASGWSSAGLSRGPQSVLSAHSGTSDIALVPRRSGASPVAPEEKLGVSEPSMLPSPFSLSYQETSTVGRLPPVIPAPTFTTIALHTPPHSQSRSQSPSTPPALSQTPITAQPLLTFSSGGPLQHQDAGRVTELVLYPDEVPPAYVDARGLEP